MNWKQIVGILLIVMGVLHIFGIVTPTIALGGLTIGVGLLAI